ncbi:MAG: GNAT family N-acetyltransferase [Clostridia bacterium]|nr:GNAT family N-acetyltransferase [Clostridia bacterium]
MQLSHPIGPYQGLDPRDCFIVSNDQQVPMGTGTVISFMQGEMYPDAPLRIFISIEAQPAARSLLLGALLARAEEKRAEAPGLRARLYTIVSPEDADLLSFYEKAGFKADDTQDVWHFELPAWSSRVPVSCNLLPVTLRSQEDAMAFMQRLNTYRIEMLDMNTMIRCMQMEHFCALGFYRGVNPVSEVLLAGQGDSVSLVGLYVRADYRRQGFAKAIIGAAAEQLRSHGVEHISANIFSSIPAQTALMRAAAARKIRTVAVMPGADLEPDQ